MNDPQIWSIIGVLAATMLGGMGLLATVINRATAAGFKAVDAKFEAMKARFDAVDFKLDHLDRDIAAIARQVWGDRRTDG